MMPLKSLILAFIILCGFTTNNSITIKKNKYYYFAGCIERQAGASRNTYILTQPQVKALKCSMTENELREFVAAEFKNRYYDQSKGKLIGEIDVVVKDNWNSCFEYYNATMKDVYLSKIPLRVVKDFQVSCE